MVYLVVKYMTGFMSSAVIIAKVSVTITRIVKTNRGVQSAAWTMRLAVVRILKTNALIVRRQEMMLITLLMILSVLF